MDDGSGDFVGVSFAGGFNAVGTLAVLHRRVDETSKGWNVVEDVLVVPVFVEANLAFDEIDFDVVVGYASVEDGGKFRHAPVKGVEGVGWGAGEEEGDGVHAFERIEDRRDARLCFLAASLSVQESLRRS